MIEVTGMTELLRQIEQMGETVNSQLENKALKEGAELMRDKVKEVVSVRTGKLKDNIIISNVENGVIHIGPDQQGDGFYGLFLELGRKSGTSKNGRRYPAMSAQPFMGPAYENNKEAVQNKMADVIKRELGL